MSAQRARRYELDCGHVVYWTTAPSPGDMVFCTRCNNETQIGPVAAKAALWTYQDFWRSRRARHKGGYRYEGECMDPVGRGWNRPTEPRCHHLEAHSDWFEVRNRLEAHYMTEHVVASERIHVGPWSDTNRPEKQWTVPNRLPRNARPPF